MTVCEGRAACFKGFWEMLGLYGQDTQEISETKLVVNQISLGFGLVMLIIGNKA